MTLFSRLVAKSERLWTKLDTLRGRYYCKLHGVKIGKQLHVRGKLYINIGNRIEIGDNCRINSAIWANQTAGDRTAIRMMGNGTLKVGNNCGISNVRISCENRIEIGDNVCIGAGTCIWDTDFHPMSYRNGTELENVIVSKPIYIKDNAFIGANCIILKGVNIGANAVVGAGSVVTRDIPDGEVWAGNPARKVKG